MNISSFLTQVAAFVASFYIVEQKYDPDLQLSNMEAGLLPPWVHIHIKVERPVRTLLTV